MPIKSEVKVIMEKKTYADKTYEEVVEMCKKLNEETQKEEE